MSATFVGLEQDFAHVSKIGSGGSGAARRYAYEGQLSSTTTAWECCGGDMCNSPEVHIDQLMAEFWFIDPSSSSRVENKGIGFSQSPSWMCHAHASNSGLYFETP